MRRALHLPRSGDWLAFLLMVAGFCAFAFIVPNWYHRYGSSLDVKPSRPKRALTRRPVLRRPVLRRPSSSPRVRSAWQPNAVRSSARSWIASPV